MIQKMLCGILMGDGYNTPYSMKVCLPCWFLVSIIQLRILFMLIPINKFSSILLTIASIVCLVLLKNNDVDLWFCLDSSLMAIPYFLLGHYMNKWMKTEYTNKTLIISGIGAALWVYIILYINGAAQMNGPSYGSNILLNYSAGIAGTIVVMSLSMLLSKKIGEQRSNHTISRNTLFIIFFHWVLLIPTGVIIRELLAVLCTRVDYILLMTVVVSIGILAISDMAIVYGSKRFPMLYGKQKR